jgi:hypothetical protein
MDTEMSQRIALAGSLKWDDRVKIKDVIFNLKQRLGVKLDVISGGLKNGADSICKKFCLEFDIEFAETPPHDYQWTPYCTEPSYMYGKGYNSKNIYIRNEKLSNDCDILIMFRLKDDDSQFLDDLIKRFQKKGKKILVIN